jgi:predicted Zn-dependent peptidase
MGVSSDIRKGVYEAVPNFSMKDLSNFHNSYIKNDNYTIMVLGNKNLKLDVLKQYGKIKHLTLEDVFGY